MFLGDPTRHTKLPTCQALLPDRVDGALFGCAALDRDFPAFVVSGVARVLPFILRRTFSAGICRSKRSSAANGNFLALGLVVKKLPGLFQSIKHD